MQPLRPGARVRPRHCEDRACRCDGAEETDQACEACGGDGRVCVTVPIVRGWGDDFAPPEPRGHDRCAHCGLLPASGEHRLALAEEDADELAASSRLGWGLHELAEAQRREVEDLRAEIRDGEAHYSQLGPLQEFHRGELARWRERRPGAPPAGHALQRSHRAVRRGQYLHLVRPPGDLSPDGGPRGEIVGSCGLVLGVDAEGGAARVMLSDGAVTTWPLGCVEHLTPRPEAQPAARLAAPSPSAVPAACELGALLDIVALVTALGEVERATAHPDGRPETDTTHSVMVALIGAYLAPAFGVDAAGVVVLALAHDLPEAICGDVPTLQPLDDEARARKARAEREATDQIRRRLPVIGAWIEAYESQDTPEARFVCAIDKLAPKLMAVRDGGAAARHSGASVADLRATHGAQRELYAAWPELGELVDNVTAHVEFLVAGGGCE